jgi:hypothetical protein
LTVSHAIWQFSNLAGDHILYVSMRARWHYGVFYLHAPRKTDRVKHQSQVAACRVEIK